MKDMKKDCGTNTIKANKVGGTSGSSSNGYSMKDVKIPFDQILGDSLGKPLPKAPKGL